MANKQTIFPVPPLTLLQDALVREQGYSPVRLTGNLLEVEMLSPAGVLVYVDEMGCIATGPRYH